MIQIGLTEGDSAPTITIGANALAISHLAFDSQSSLGDPGPGILASPFHFYTAGNAVSWSGAGILTNFNMSQFNPGTYRSSSHPNFFSHALRLTIRNEAIPEPQEYAFVFGLFALGFVLVRRHCQPKKQRPAQAITTS